MVTALDLQNKFQVLKTRKSKNIYTATATGANLTVVPGKALSYAANQYFTEDDHGGAAAGHLDEATAAADITLIQDLFKKDHADVKFDSRWKRLYQNKARLFTFMKSNGSEFEQPISSYPCHYCGIILPDSMIEVDHRQPQKSPGVAVLKVIHSLTGAYTTDKGKGTKAKAVGQIASAPSVAFTPPMMATVNQLPQINPKGLVSGCFFTEASMAVNIAKHARYTITDEGKTFLSVASMYLDNVELYCVNSLLNLVPSCCLCNGAAGKSSKIHAQGMKA